MVEMILYHSVTWEFNLVALQMIREILLMILQWCKFVLLTLVTCDKSFLHFHMAGNFIEESCCIEWTFPSKVKVDKGNDAAILNGASLKMTLSNNLRFIDATKKKKRCENAEVGFFFF